MTHCRTCGDVILGRAYPTEIEVSHTKRDGKITERRFEKVLICENCAEVRAKTFVPRAVGVIVIVIVVGLFLGLSWLFSTRT